MLVEYKSLWRRRSLGSALNERPFWQLIPSPENKSIPIVKYVGTLDLIVRDHLEDGRVRYVDISL